MTPSKDARFLAKPFLQWVRETGYDLTQQSNIENEFDTDDDSDDDKFDERRGPKNGVEFDDDYDDYYKNDDSDSMDPEPNTQNLVEDEQYETQGLEAGRVTRSGRVFNNAPARQVDTLNPRVQAEMRRLVTTCFTALPERHVMNDNDDQPNAPPGREVVESEELDEPQNVGLNAMDHLFGDITFYMRENYMVEMDARQQS